MWHDCGIKPSTRWQRVTMIGGFRHMLPDQVRLFWTVAPNPLAAMLANHHRLAAALVEAQDRMQHRYI
jgi:hypothetical protein